MTHPKRQLVIDRAISQNHYITDQDVEVSLTLRLVALDFISTYTGHSSFVQDLCVRYHDVGNSSIRQMRGALNVMVVEARAALLDQETVQAAQADKPLILDFSGKAPQAAQDAPTVTAEVFNGTYTVVLNEAGDYRTLRLADCPESYNKPTGTQIASFLSGPDNESSYTGFAFVFGAHHILWKNRKGGAVLEFALIKLLRSENPFEYGKAYALKSGNCFVCNRKLTTPESIKAGIGPICASRLGIDTTDLAPTHDQAVQEINELFPDK